MLAKAANKINENYELTDEIIENKGENSSKITNDD